MAAAAVVVVVVVVVMAGTAAAVAMVATAGEVVTAAAVAATVEVVVVAGMGDTVAATAVAIPSQTAAREGGRALMHARRTHMVTAAVAAAAAAAVVVVVALYTATVADVPMRTSQEAGAVGRRWRLVALTRFPLRWMPPWTRHAAVARMGMVTAPSAVVQAPRRASRRLAVRTVRRPPRARVCSFLASLTR